VVSQILYVIYALLAFSFLVLIHELGHFIVARLNGVKVEEFAIGMGPKIYSYQGKETMYSIRLLPIGGYNKMLGEYDGANGEVGEDTNFENLSDNPKSLTSKKNWQRFLIIAAGPFMNLIGAIMLFAIVNIGAGGFQTLGVDSLTDNSPAKEAGILPGDNIVKIDGNKVKYVEDLKNELLKANGNKVTVEVNRGGDVKSFDITPAKGEAKGDYNLGFIPVIAKNPSILQALNRGVYEVKFMVKLTFDFFKDLFTGKADIANSVGGPVTIVKVSVAQAKAGWLNLVYFMALMSVQLAVFNILPIPALDGGYLLLYLFQMITRKKISEQKVGSIVTVGFLILMGLMVIVTIKDVLFPVNI